MRLALSLLLVFFSLVSIGQSQVDFYLLKNHSISFLNGVNKPISFLKPNKGKAGPLKLVLGSLMYCYQVAVSPALMSNCPHKPSCSQFGKDCFEQFGLLKAIGLTADRLTRCTPFGIQEYEQVVHPNFDDFLLDNANDYHNPK